MSGPPGLGDPSQPFLLPPPPPPPPPPPGAHMQGGPPLNGVGHHGGPPGPPHPHFNVVIKTEPSELDFKPPSLDHQSSHEEILNSEFGQSARETAPTGRTVLGMCLVIESVLY